jgi:hypothetical protein
MLITLALLACLLQAAIQMLVNLITADEKAAGDAKASQSMHSAFPSIAHCLVSVQERI